MARSLERASAVASELGARAHAVQCDVTDDASPSSRDAGVKPRTPKPFARESVSVNTLARVKEIQIECLADDLPLSEGMAQWSERRLRDFFEGGGVEVE